MSQDPEAPDTLLIVDDDPGLRMQIRWALDGYTVLTAHDRASAVEQFRRHRPAVVTMDLGLPPSPQLPDEGLAAIGELLAIDPTAKVIAVTGQSENAFAARALRLGAFDFFAKPFDASTLQVVVGRAFRMARLERGGTPEPQQPGESATTPSGQSSLHRPNGPAADADPELDEVLPGLWTGDPAVRRLAAQVRRLAPTGAGVLIRGESGTGKELLARALHQGAADRAKGRLVAINCAAIPETLLESELFGHERGAFTGAVATRAGRIESADGGTLFLDEIGDLPLPLQPKLLRFLQDRVIERIGGRQEIRVDVRVVCATHRNLRQMVADGQFREDLFYRLAELELALPPLRGRGADALGLALMIIAEDARAKGRPPLPLSPGARQAILGHDWPGNVRELQNAIRRALILASPTGISVDDLGLTRSDGPLRAAAGASRDATAPAQQPSDPSSTPDLSLRVHDDQQRRRLLADAMHRAGGNISLAARLLGVSRPTVYEMLKRFGMRE